MWSKALEVYKARHGVGQSGVRTEIRHRQAVHGVCDQERLLDGAYVKGDTHRGRGLPYRGGEGSVASKDRVCVQQRQGEVVDYGVYEAGKQSQAGPSYDEMYGWLLEAEEFEVASTVGTGPVSINGAVKDFLEN